MTSQDELWAQLVEFGICTECQEAHTVHVGRFHRMWYCTHSQRAVFQVGREMAVAEGMTLAFQRQFMTNVHRRISGKVN